MSSFLGAVADAWAEIRIHKMRVLLSLIGIAVSVAALTAVVAFGEYQRQYQTEQSDRYGGRVATIGISVSSADGTPVASADFDAQFAQETERFGFSHTTHVVDGLLPKARLPEGFTDVNLRLIDPAYPVIHRSQLADGRWFRDGDAEALSPPVVVSEALWERLGSIPLAQHPTVVLDGDAGGTYQIVGITPRDGQWDETLQVIALYDSYRSRVDEIPSDASVLYEVWVGADQVGSIGPVLAMDLRAGLPEGQDLTVYRSDWASQQGAEDSIRIFELVTGGIAGLILLLGGLGLVNIQLVAMRQRVREIGVRRAFGATAGRIFVSVLLESLVATTVAGLVGIVIVVALLRSDLIVPNLFSGMQDVPPFPLRAALIGLVSSVAIGAIAGFIPALVALRVRVIDAIRF